MLPLHCQNDFCIKMGSDESHLNPKTVSIKHNFFFFSRRESSRGPSAYLPKSNTFTARPNRLTGL